MNGNQLRNPVFQSNWYVDFGTVRAENFFSRNLILLIEGQRADQLYRSSNMPISSVHSVGTIGTFRVMLLLDVAKAR